MSHRIVTEQVNAPAAGTDWTIKPSPTDKVLLLTVTATLTTSAVVASRRVSLNLKDQNALGYWCADAVMAQAASLAVTYSWARGASLGPPAALVASEKVALPFPWLRLQPSDTVSAITALIDVGDVWSKIVYRAIVGDWWEDEHELAQIAQALAMGAAG